MKPIVIESPFAGDIELNLRYVRACMADALHRGEAPFASHALYTQQGVLKDDVPEERCLGIDAGFCIGEALLAHCGKVVFYIDRGWSCGMKAALEKWSLDGVDIRVRALGGEFGGTACDMTFIEASVKGLLPKRPGPYGRNE